VEEAFLTKNFNRGRNTGLFELNTQRSIRVNFEWAAKASDQSGDDQKNISRQHFQLMQGYAMPVGTNSSRTPYIYPI
jgi:hypothetical protein